MHTCFTQVPAHWQLLDTKRVHNNPVYEVHERLYQHPQRQTKDLFYIVEMASGVSVVPLTADNKIVLVQQYRFACDQLLWELPGGRIDNGENPIECAQRELLEEAGYAGEAPILFGHTYSNPAFTDGQLYFVGIKNCRFIQAPTWDEHEELLVREVTLSEFKEMIHKGHICNSTALTALCWAHLYGMVQL